MDFSTLKKKFLQFFCLLAVSSLLTWAMHAYYSASNRSNVEKISLVGSGSQWEFLYNGDWYPANVPGNIHDDLLQNGLIPDPHFGTNEDSVQWVADSVWTYRTYFGAKSLKKHKQLVFKGLDTYAEVLLNGNKLAATDGTTLTNNMFCEWRFDLDGVVLNDMCNELIVRFLPSAPFEEKAAAELDYRLPDNRVFSRKAQYESGWDWGPNLVTCGIWEDAYIESWENFHIADSYVRDVQPTLDPNGTWKTELELTILADEECKLDLAVSSKTFEELTGIGARVSNEERQWDRIQERWDRKRHPFKYLLRALRELWADYKETLTVNVKKGENTVRVPVEIRNPRLWWPNGMGKQSRYYYIANLSNREGKERLFLSHALRTIELRQEPDSIGESFELIVNGLPTFIRGCNWIPATSYPGTAGRNGEYNRLLKDCQAVNMNMVRIWGGGYYEKEDFYDACDRYGLLVWQDFMFACNLYPADSAFLQNVENEAAYQVKRLRKHPCIAVWCGNNEVHNGWKDWGWQAQFNYTPAQCEKLYSDYQRLFERLLPDVVEKYSGAPYVHSSPRFGWGHPECCTHGPAHYWGVWWGEQPFEVWEEKTGRFMTEYGFQSYPEISTLEGCTAPEERTLFSAAMKNHQKHGRGVQIIRKAMKDDFGYTRTSDLAEFAYVSQLVQAYGIRQAIDIHRIRHDHCRGTLYWQLNDCWPVASWSSIDHCGRWKALHHYLRGAYANISIAVRQSSGNQMDIYVVNDSLKDVAGRFSYEIINLDGTPSAEPAHEENVRIATNSAQKVATLSVPKEKAGKVCVVAKLISEGTEVACRIAYFAKPKELQLSKNEIDVDVSVYQERYDEDRFRITLSSPTLQYGVQITDSTGNVLHLSDNYFDLLPGERKVVEGSVKGDPKICVRSLNGSR